MKFTLVQFILLKIFLYFHLRKNNDQRLTTNALTMRAYCYHRHGSHYPARDSIAESTWQRSLMAKAASKRLAILTPLTTGHKNRRHSGWVWYRLVRTPKTRVDMTPLYNMVLPQQHKRSKQALSVSYKPRLYSRLTLTVSGVIIGSGIGGITTIEDTAVKLQRRSA